MTDFLDRLEAQCRERGSAPALARSRGTPVSFRTMGQRIQAIQRNLERGGLRPGDRVLFAVRPSPEAVLLILATFRSGGIIVAADVGTGPELFAARMAMIKPTWVMAESIVYAAAAIAPARRWLQHRGVCLPDLRGLPVQFVRVGRRWPGVPPGPSFQSLCHASGNESATRPSIPPEGPAFVVFTSGTTEAPRAVVHTLRSIGAALDTIADALALEPHYRVSANELHLIIPALLAGARVHIPSGRLAGRATLAEWARSGATHTFVVPADLRQIVDRCVEDRVKLPASLRALMIGAAPIPASLLRALHPLLPSHTAVSCVYAMTEAMPVARTSLERKLSYQGPGEYVGQPFPKVGVRVADDGELFVSGDVVCGGFATGVEGREAPGSDSLRVTPIRELATGDLARLEPDGAIVLCGRTKDMIIRGHHNIYPGLYEPTIERIPGVRRCAMIGLDEASRSDERVVLAVEPDAGHAPAAVKRRVAREMQSGPFRIDASAYPDDLVVVALPTSGRSHKIDRVTLRQLIREKR